MATTSLQVRPWTYRGLEVKVPFSADIPTSFRPGNRHGGLVQQALDATKEPWNDGDNPIMTIEGLRSRLNSLVVLNLDRVPVWGFHTGHRARYLELSPFVEWRQDETTRCVTIELSGSSDDPKIERAYAGEYSPPLPWMISAGGADGGVAYCRWYWAMYSYSNPGLIRPGTRTDQVPAWRQ